MEVDALVKLSNSDSQPTFVRSFHVGSDCPARDFLSSVGVRPLDASGTSRPVRV